MNNINKDCAPIIIPTLNRYSHLKKCIMSLVSNELAERSDLYISVDYPPNDSYMIGYKKVLQYLDNDISGFNTVRIFYQKKNLGSHKNFIFLLDYVSNYYTNFIYTEDDNTFSSDFLYYMNYCLKRYKDDANIQAINGYMWPIRNNNEDNKIIRICSYFNAWGYGGWIDKEYKVINEINDKKMMGLWKNNSAMYELKKKNPFLYSEFIKSYVGYSGCLYEESEIRANDLAYCIVEFVDNMFTIFPVTSRVKNNGNDGSGQNCVSISYDASSEQNNRNFDYSSQVLKECNYRNYIEIESKDSVDFLEQELREFLIAPPKEVFKADLVYRISRIIGISAVRTIVSFVKRFV